MAARRCVTSYSALFIAFCHENVISLKLTLCVCPAVSPFLLHLLSPLQDDGCGFANHELSPVPHPLGHTLSAPSALFPVVLPCFLLPLSVSVLFPLSVSPSPSLLASV